MYFVILAETPGTDNDKVGSYSIELTKGIAMQNHQIFWHHLGPFEAIWGHLEPFLGILDNLGPFGIVSRDAHHAPKRLTSVCTRH